MAGGGEGEDSEEVKRMEVHCKYTHKDNITKPTKHCLKDGGQGREVIGI
jgi:hypothetical protein